MRRIGTRSVLLFALLLCALLGSCKDSIPVAPEGAVLSLLVAAGGDAPEAADFLSPAYREELTAAGVTVSFGTDISFSAVGEQTVSLLLTAPGGRAVSLSAACTVIEDTEPPAFSGVCDRSVLLGDGISLRDGVSVTDNCFGAVTWDVDTGNLNLSEAGYYQVYYTAADAAGNRVTLPVYVTVYEQDVTEEMVRAQTEPLISAFTAGKTREEICRAVYDYVQSHISYFVISDKTDYVRAAYDALFVSGRGDCFSYCSAARLLLELCGVEVLEITRTPGVTADTHYWLLCNIAEPGEAPRWYHLDATPLDDGFGAVSGCLRTDGQLAAYCERRPHFYEYDKTAYPASATEIITP